MMKKDAKIYIAGHLGMAGSAFMRKLLSLGYTNLVYRKRDELDLLDQHAVVEFFLSEKPEYVFFSAAKVGGILANSSKPADFLYENLQIQNNIIHQSFLHGVKKLLFLGSSCVYPKFALQPMKEAYLLTGELEQTNEPYAIAKIAGIKLCQSYNRQYGTDFIAIMPTNLYGPNDNYDLETSHVLPALIRKFYEAVREKKSSIEVWGSGMPRREFLHVDDMADASIFLMNTYTPTKEQNEKGEMFFNVGTGTDITIIELSEILRNISGFLGDIVWNTERPDGTPQKLLDISRMSELGWRHSILLREGIQRTYNEYSAGYVDN